MGRITIDICVTTHHKTITFEVEERNSDYIFSNGCPTEIPLYFIFLFFYVFLQFSHNLTTFVFLRLSTSRLFEKKITYLIFNENIFLLLLY